MNTLSTKEILFFIRESINQIIEIYVILILIKLGLTWFPIIPWYRQPFYALETMIDPYLNLFKGIFPLVLNLDFSPIIGLLLLQAVSLFFKYKFIPFIS
uniref:Ycf19 n=1 Tax=Pterocladiophila hemisphaerica TaxID=2712948 RepID=A0A6M3WWD3_9FLOR|nr:Ycf19 [Pterocladiophila hemisphaerica]